MQGANPFFIQTVTCHNLVFLLLPPPPPPRPPFYFCLHSIRKHSCFSGCCAYHDRCAGKGKVGHLPLYALRALAIVCFVAVARLLVSGTLPLLTISTCRCVHVYVYVCVCVCACVSLRFSAFLLLVTFLSPFFSLSFPHRHNHRPNKQASKRACECTCDWRVSCCAAWPHQHRDHFITCLKGGALPICLFFLGGGRIVCE